MQQKVHELSVATQGKGLFDITPAVTRWVSAQGLTTGLLTLFCRHTSASLLIQENADPDVRTDILAYFERLAPEDPRRYVHSIEGPDDMPAHLRVALTQVQLSIPLMGGRLALGTWQGIYLFEHRCHSQNRRIALHLLGD
ncbi:secondary thiamine-phosphate synthase enzyme YjbQ [Arboricoccus pini]|uniref:secondary thiamine-phosphate synthase enzyme YjbQ n=1 Tax=Arboricoccus pini TaxID=1963835 RepID=UPI000B50FAC0|nr:secondary thiamine-phosphate synthase enzyme YjbQ [Arboricoccus pini]